MNHFRAKTKCTNVESEFFNRGFSIDFDFFQIAARCSLHFSQGKFVTKF